MQETELSELHQDLTLKVEVDGNVPEDTNAAKQRLQSMEIEVLPVDLLLQLMARGLH